MKARAWSVLRLALPAAVLGLLVVRLGGRPFLDALRVTSVPLALAAIAITIVTTVCCAWRWRTVSAGLGAPIPFGRAVASYYRSQLLNGLLPAGVLGDVHRGVCHGRDAGDVARGIRAVVWERSAGQAVQVTLSVVVLAAWAAPGRRFVLPAMVALVALGVATVLVVRLLPLRCRTLLRTELVDGVLDRRALPVVLLTSVGSFAGHLAVFLLAVHAVAPRSSVTAVLPAAVVVLLVAAIPVNLAGWGPREGAAVWALTAAGLTPAHALEAGVVYGVLSFVATLPGAAVLISSRARAARRPVARPPAVVHG